MSPQVFLGWLLDSRESGAASRVRTSSNKTSQMRPSGHFSVDGQMKLRHAGHSRGGREKGEREGGRDGGKAGRCLHRLVGRGRRTQFQASGGWRRLAQAQAGESRLPHLYMKLHCTDHLQNNYRTTTEQLTEQLQNNS